MIERNLPVDEIEIRLLFEAIYLRFHYDFRSYSMASLKRRVAAALAALSIENVSALQERLMHKPETFAQLLQYLTVQVSDMFRDPEFFKTFRTQIVPELATYPSLKFWIAGCSSGEEAYSFAIALEEEGLLDRTMIYATDINPLALEKAEAGIYDQGRIPSFVENHAASGGKAPLAEYYTAAYEGAIFKRSLRSHIVFADHSLATDTVFAEVHLVSCRNVLIYFDRALQTRALGLFRSALTRRGYLGLGAREALFGSPHGQAFREIQGGTKWYQRW